jgi:hypothetical protein
MPPHLSLLHHWFAMLLERFTNFDLIARARRYSSRRSGPSENPNGICYSAPGICGSRDPQFARPLSTSMME